jgi:dCMP deaminase
MSKDKQLSWDEYFAQLTVLTSQKSEDESTKCGAVIVTATNEIVSTGYNGFPRGIKDTPERQERPLKYKFFEHSERNALYNCSRNGIPTLGTKMYITGRPCTDCSRAIIQCGIREIVVLTNQRTDFNVRWKEDFDLAEQLLKEASVEIRTYTPHNLHEKA